MGSAAEDVRCATAADVREVAALLDAFNREFDTPTPGASVLATRLEQLLARGDTFAILAGSAAVGVALVTLRPNVWFDSPVALLDELYVVPEQRGHGVGSAILGAVVARCRELGVDLIEINVDEGDVDAQRFYERHGFAPTEAGSTERAFYFTRELRS